VVLGEEVVEKLRTIYESVRDDSDSDKLVGTIAEDDSFQDMMETVVRESLDGEKETLENLLNRILNDHQ
jgi:nitrogen regulatory protein PII-like uncharacterized protein